MSLDAILSPVADDLAIVESRLRDRVAADLPAVFADAVGYLIDAGGKRLRPACVLLAAGLRGDASDEAIDLAADVEMIHMASLVHDDMIDEASERRGAPTLHVRWNPSLALLVGDLLYSQILDRLSRDGRRCSLRAIAHAIHRMVVGQLAETVRRDDITITEPEYFAIIDDKTAALFSCSTLLGAHSGRLSPEECEKLTRFGKRFGSAYQIVDDILDICGDAKGLGKPTGADLREGKVTLPIIHALREDTEGRVAGLFSARDAVGMSAAVCIHGSLEYALGRADEAAREARECLADMPDGPQRDGLLGLVEHAMARGREAVVRVTAASEEPKAASAGLS